MFDTKEFRIKVNEQLGRGFFVYPVERHVRSKFEHIPFTNRTARRHRPRKRSTLVNVLGPHFSSTSHLQVSDKFGYGILPTRNGRPYAPSMLWTWTAEENYLWVRKTCQSLPGVPIVGKEMLAVRDLFNTYLLSHDRSTLPT